MGDAVMCISEVVGVGVCVGVPDCVDFVGDSAPDGMCAAAAHCAVAAV